MAAWIGASDSQRFWQYLVPAARAALARGDHDSSREWLLGEVRKVEASYAADTSALRDKRRERRLADLRNLWRGIARAEAIDRETVAKADRLKSQRQARSLTNV